MIVTLGYDWRRNPIKVSISGRSRPANQHPAHRARVLVNDARNQPGQGLSALSRFPRNSGEEAALEAFLTTFRDANSMSQKITESTAQCVEIFCSEELYVPDYSSKGLEAG
jgi:hypothetical protein